MASPAGTISHTILGGSSAAASASRLAEPTAPSDANRSTAAGSGSETTQRCPSRISRRAMFDPMRPRPTTPSPIGRSVVIWASLASVRRHPVSESDDGQGKPTETTADALVCFGITGDLGNRMTLPALYRLELRGALPCDVIGVGRQERPPDQLRAMAREAVEKAEGSVDDEVFERFAERFSYIAADAEDPASYERLREALG